MARVILDGFRDYEEALAFAEWFGYNSVEVDAGFVVEADLVSARKETDSVEMDVVTHDTGFKETDVSDITDFGDIYSDDEES